jgi:hypothetical protein
VLELFAEQASIAILNARRHEQALRAMQTLDREKAELHSAFADQRARETHLRREARCDPLTGLQTGSCSKSDCRSCWPRRYRARHR